MFTTLTIDGREMGFAANAATPFRFKQTFHKDLFYILGNETRAAEEGDNTTCVHHGETGGKSRHEQVEQRRVY